MRGWKAALFKLWGEKLVLVLFKFASNLINYLNITEDKCFMANKRCQLWVTCCQKANACTQNSTSHTHTQYEHLKWPQQLCVLADLHKSKSAWDHRWASLGVLSCPTSSCYQMHGKAITHVQLEGNSPKEEQTGMCYSRDDCFATQKTMPPEGQIYHCHSSGLQKSPQLRLIPVIKTRVRYAYWIRSF